jgi:dolichol-phosphate mannosyltransferase
MADKPLLSIVVPVYNEEESLPLLRSAIDGVLSELPLRAEIILVDDGSKDGSAAIMRRYAQEDARYKAVILSRNCGHQLALTAGLDHAVGDAVVVLDADLQDPPELIPKMVARWREGYEVVYGQRKSREGESFLKKATANIFYRVIRYLSGVDIPENVGDFRLMDRKVVEALKRMPEHFRFVRGMVAWVGFKQCPILFDRPKRAAGSTKYPWSKMVRFAFDAIFAFSTIPLRLSTMFGLLVMAAAAAEIVHILYLRLVLNAVIPGFTPIFVSVLFLGGFNLVTLGILGEYIGRIYVEAKGRPLYFVSELVSKTRESGNVPSRD